ncbi:MAG: DNA gyrase inhibitor YacG [Sedimentisphaerales bacterium]|nr:DNA gyrase inhibitor YacG [Sedimentisphaerales bacterium]
MNVKCPICKKSVNGTKGEDGLRPRWLPFCSERCKLIDLGRWLDADYRMTVKQDENEDSEPLAGDGGEDI